MASALVTVCVDPRINHELIRIQVRQRLERDGIRGARIYVLNEIGANPGVNVRNTLQVLARARDPVVFGAVLHHDDCLTAQQGLRVDLAAAAQQMAAELSRATAHAPVFTGEIRTEHNHVLWSDEPEWRYVPFTFGAGAPLSGTGRSVRIAHSGATVEGRR